MQKMKLPTRNRLFELVYYVPETGIFYSIKTNKQIGSTKNSRVPYVLIGIDGKQYYAHRLAWVYMTGEEPKDIIDHKDGNGLNNKWENLREANKRQNAANSKVKSTSKLGVRGISKNREGYLVRICLGTYETLEEAIKVYNEAMFYHHGEFAKLSVKPEQQPNA